MIAREDPSRLRSVARRLLWGALVCLLLPALALLGAALYDGLRPVTGGDGTTWLAIALVLSLAPVGIVLLALGLMAGTWAWWLQRQAGS